MYDGPIREGSRGGRDQFSWESVKGDKDREFYLGHSVKALVGHWQKNKDPYWYAKDKDRYRTTLQDEVKAVKQREEELMQEALGLKKQKQKHTTDFGKKLQKYEVDELLRRRDEEGRGEEEMEALGSRGLGFRRTSTTLASASTHEVLEGVGIGNARRPPLPSTDRHPSPKQHPGRQRKNRIEKKPRREKESKKKHRRMRHRSRSRQGIPSRET